MLLPINLQKNYSENTDGFLPPMEERTKTLYVAKKFLKYRQEDLERILSDEGILFRINRSIQVEGSFGELKQDRTEK